jgi:hypothetical protein
VQNGPPQLLYYKQITPVVPLESALLQVFILKNLNGDYAFDTETEFGMEIGSDIGIASFRTCQPCYHAREMKVEKRKFDHALTKMLRAKPEPRKKIKTPGRRSSKTPILAKP